MLGDTAVCVHPTDERYTHLIGKHVRIPVNGRLIPIIADALLADKTLGTGCVKVTPAHDFNDYAVGQRHHLPMMSILSLDAKINAEAPAAYQGLDRFVARKQVVKDLEALVDSALALVDRDADIAIFMAVRQEDRRFALYPLAHAMHTMVIALLTARQAGWPAERQRSLAGAVEHF